MRDIALLLILMALGWVVWLRPWLGVLGLAVLNITHPQAAAIGIMKDAPVYLMFFAFTLLAAGYRMVRNQQLPTFVFDWRIACLALLWALFVFTTIHSSVPWMAWDRLWQTSAVMMAALLAWWLIDTREKLFWLLIVIATSIALYTLKGGYWAVMTGFHDRVYGPPGSQFYGNNEFAVVVAMNIPLLVLWYRQCGNRQLRGVLAVMVGLSYVAVISSWSRGGILALAAMTLPLLWHSNRRVRAVLLLGIGILGISAFLPEDWFTRMGTLTAVQRDESAMGRIEVWRVGLHQAFEHPLRGVGFEGWRFANLDTPGYRDWHSAYVQMMAEHGLIGLGLWLALLLGTMLGLARLSAEGSAWESETARMLLATLSAYTVGAVFLSIAYWELYFLLIIGTARIYGFAEAGKPP